MGVFVPFPYGVQVELLFVLDGQVVENRLWFWTDAFDPPGSAELLGLAQGVYEWHAANLLPYLSQDLRLGSVVATDWSIEGGPFEVYTLGGEDGGIAEESHSANVAVVVPFRWPLQYSRRKRNKNYVPGVPVSGIDLNTPTAFTRDFLFEGYAALIDAARTFSPGDYWYWVVTSAIEAGGPRSEMAFGVSTGPAPRSRLLAGQRRRRLPPMT